ncbi:hypothetical protein [Pyrococcus kukulkanii]|uniref:hypothetical protein n=1 Tax=Pyrococcus kukulkanii TaxID=1609559 RepID=UPI00356ABB6B
MAFSMKEYFSRRLGERVITTIDLARETGLSRHFVRREFHRWCLKRGESPHQYFYPGVGFVLPREFVEEVREYARRRGA